MMRSSKFIMIIACFLIAGCTKLNGILDKKTPVIEASKVIELKNRWWGVFNDPLMDRLADEVVAQNLDIKIAQQKVLQSRAFERISQSGLFPEVTATATASRGNTSSLKTASISQGGFDASWEIDIFGKTAAMVDASKQRTNSSIASSEDITNFVIAEIIRYVIDYRAAQQTLKEINSLLAIQNEQVALFSARAKAGLTDSTFLARAKAERAQTATNIPLARASLDAAQFKIERLLGKPSGSLSSELSQFESSLIAPSISNSLEISIETMRNRPDIRAARFDMLASQADLGKAEADLWPTISLQSFFGVKDGSNGLLLADNPIWSLASSITAPVLNFGRLRGAIDEANSKAKIASLSYEKATLTAMEETQVSLSDYVNGVNAVSEQKRALSFRKETVKLASERFKRGLTDMTDLTTAQAELNSATILLINRQTATAIAYVRLQKALGVSISTIGQTSKIKP